MKYARGVFIALLALVAQTESTIDMSAIVSLMMSLIFVMLPIIIVLMVLRMFTGIFDSFGKLFQVKIRAFRRAVVRLFPAPLSLAPLLAQTETPALSEAVSMVSSLIYALLPIIIVVLVISIFLQMTSKLTRLARD